MVLTVKQIEAAKFGTQKERMSDGTGLYLRLYPSGKKAFQMQVARSASERQRVWVSLGDGVDASLPDGIAMCQAWSVVAQENGRRHP